MVYLAKNKNRAKNCEYSIFSTFLPEAVIVTLCLLSQFAVEQFQSNDLNTLTDS